MANKVVQLVDENNDNLYPLSSDPNAAHITMTTTDPGEGTALGQNEFVAVYGGSTKVGTSDIVDGAVTSDKIDWATMGDVVYRPGNSISLNSTWGSITVDTNVNRARLFIPLNKIPNGVTSVSLSTGDGSKNYGFVVSSSNGAVYPTRVAGDQTVTGTITHQGVLFSVDLSASVGSTYCTGNIILAAGSISFS